MRVSIAPPTRSRKTALARSAARPFSSRMQALPSAAASARRHAYRDRARCRVLVHLSGERRSAAARWARASARSRRSPTNPRPTMPMRSIFPAAIPNCTPRRSRTNARTRGVDRRACRARKARRRGMRRHAVSARFADGPSTARGTRCSAFFPATPRCNASCLARLAMQRIDTTHGAMTGHTFHYSTLTHADAAVAHRHARDDGHAEAKRSIGMDRSPPPTCTLTGRRIRPQPPRSFAANRYDDDARHPRRRSISPSRSSARSRSNQSARRARTSAGSIQTTGLCEGCFRSREEIKALQIDGRCREARALSYAHSSDMKKARLNEPRLRSRAC